MNKHKKKEELLAVMKDYVIFMDSSKEMSHKLSVNEKKLNHQKSLTGFVDLNCRYQFGNDVKLSCEIRDENCYNYSFDILSDKFENKMLARLDEGNGTHRNKYEDIPLSEQSVSTPHFHKYDVKGRFIAYKTPSLESLNGDKLCIEDGFKVFCQEMKIVGTNGGKGEIEYLGQGLFSKDPVEEDPLNGVAFK